MTAAPSPDRDDERWTHRRFFALLERMGPLRVIHQAGASTFEALCTFGPHGFAQGYMNAITDAYHWHLKLDGFGHVRSRDRTHARSGRRVLFFELRGNESDAPFSSIYLHRAKGAEFEAEPMALFPESPRNARRRPRPRAGGRRMICSLAPRLAVWLLLLIALPGLATAETKVATLLPAVEDALRDVPGVSIVAGVRTSFRAPERTDVIDLGSPHSPNVERLAESGADIVVGDAQINGHLVDSLGRFGAEVVLVDTTDVDATLNDLAALGERVGAGDTVGPKVEAARAQLAEQKLEEPIQVLPLFGTPGRFQVVTSRAWLGSLLDKVGFVNVAADASGAQRVPGFVEVSHEYLATLRPEMVVLMAHGDPRAIQQELETKLSGAGPWAALGKSATRGVHVLSPRQFLANPGLALPGAAETLVALTNGSGAPATPAVGAGR